MTKIENLLKMTFQDEINLFSRVMKFDDPRAVNGGDLWSLALAIFTLNYYLKTCYSFIVKIVLFLMCSYLLQHPSSKGINLVVLFGKKL